MTDKKIIDTTVWRLLGWMATPGAKQKAAEVTSHLYFATFDWPADQARSYRRLCVPDEHNVEPLDQFAHWSKAKPCQRCVRRRKNLVTELYMDMIGRGAPSEIVGACGPHKDAAQWLRRFCDLMAEHQFVKRALR